MECAQISDAAISSSRSVVWFTKYGNADLRTPVNVRPSSSILQDIKVHLATIKVGQ